MEIGDVVYYARKIRETKNVIILKIRTIYTDKIVGINSKGIAFVAPNEQVFYKELDAKNYLESL